MDSARYFVAIIPPAPIFDEAFALKNYFKEKYHSKASLNSPPHITIIAPFPWSETKEIELSNSLADFARGKESFEISLAGFGAFAPRVIFISIEQNDRLVELQHGLEKFLNERLNLFADPRDDKRFHPHLTIAFRDLKKQQFDLAWQEFKGKKFLAKFNVEAFHLLKHDGQIWQSVRLFSF